MVLTNHLARPFRADYTGSTFIVTPLTLPAPGVLFSAKWSRDGGTAAYLASGSGSDLTLDVFSLSGRAVRHLIPWADSNGSPSISSDGRFIAFAQDISRVQVVATDGTPPRSVASDGHGIAGQPAWSPNNEMLAWANDNGQVVASTLAGRQVRIVDIPGWKMSEPVWLPDGRGVVVLLSSGAGAGLARVEVGQNPKPVMLTWQPRGGAVSEVSVAPDGTSIAFTDTADISRRPVPMWSLCTVDSAGTDVRQVAPEVSVSASSPPTWSPDSHWVLFAGPDGVMTVRSDGSGTLRVAGTADTSGVQGPGVSYAWVASG